MGESVWEPEEERFINRLRQTPAERQILDIRSRCEAELKTAYASFLNARNTPLTQETIKYIAKQVVRKYNNELEARGINYQISLGISAD
jgi:hypothetical protein